MTEGVTIYVLLWLLYLSECFIWLNKRGVAFVTRWNKKWQLGTPSSFIATYKGGAVLLNPLHPGTRVAVSSLSPVSISPDGICAFNAQSLFDVGRPAQTPHYFSFEEIKNCVSHDRGVLINRTPFMECTNITEAQQTANLINQMLRVPSARRQQIVDKFLAQRFEQCQALNTFATMSNGLRTLEILCSLFFPLLFIGSPIMAVRYGLAPIIIPTAFLMLAFAVTVACAAWRHHKAHAPARSIERWSSILKIVFCPPGAIRTVGDLTANFPMTCDPLVLSVLLSNEERQRFVLAYLRDLHFPIKDALEGPAKKAVDWYRAKLLKHATEYIKTQNGLRLDAMMAPPVFETGCQSYCPRCRSQFTMNASDCSVCDGVRLLRPNAALS